MRPNADIGEDHASSLTWQHDASRAVSHIVVGSGKPGGSWHQMDPSLDTVSLGNWLELPGYSFNQWKIDREEKDCVNSADMTNKSLKQKRARLGEVAQYYEDYVSKMELEKKFLNGVKVVCAADIRRPTKQNHSSIHLESRSCSTTSSSLSSSPGLDSPSHTMAITGTGTADVFCSLQSQENVTSAHDSDDIVASDDVFQVDHEALVGEQNGEQQSARPQQLLDIHVHVALTRGSEVRESSHQSDSPVMHPLQPFSTETHLTQCFPESTCCCITDPDDCGVYCREAIKLKPDYRWCIRGRSKDGTLVVKILAKKLVLACGVDQSRKLDVPGENYPFIHHHYSDLGPAINDYRASSSSNPILVVGAGLSAADAVLLALERGIRVIHAFYQDCSDPRLIFHKMPPELYKEYRQVFSLMQGKAKNDNYMPLPKHRVMEFKEGGVCRLKSDIEEKEKDEKVSSCFVLIGSDADLGFMPHRLTSMLGEHTDRPVHPKTNPISIDPFSFQSDSVPSLYAMGPLVGDNFVRFVLGGALGIAQHVVLSTAMTKDV